jgi:flavin-dependent dehydrogenase
MMEAIHADVLIVGAGMAGLSAALTILKNSPARLVILEAHHVGSNNPTPLTFSETIAQFGLELHVKASYRRFTMLSPSGSHATHTFATEALVALDYGAACETLFTRCQQAGDVPLLIERANNLLRQPDGTWEITTSKGNTIHTPLVLDASGRGLFSTQALGLPGPKLFSHSLGNLLTGVQAPDHEQAYYLIPTQEFGSGGGWFYPLQGNKASVGIAFLSPEVRFPGKKAKVLLSQALNGFPQVCDWLANAQIGEPEAGSIPIFPPRKFILHGLMRIGDAAGQATIWDCMGSEMALIGGDMAGQAAIQSIRQNDYSVGTLSQYQKAWDQQYRAIYRQAELTAPLVWRCNDDDWERNLHGLQQLTSDQMLARLRWNWPQLPLWQIYFILAYDWAGRTRRGLVKRLRNAWH